MTTRFPTDAILLAAGFGTRLRPLTETRPKPLVPVAGLPLIERVIAPLAAEGVDRFVVNAHYLADQMRAAVSALPMRFPGGGFALSIEEDQPLDTGGGAKKALELTETDPVLISNTDAFWQPADDAPLQRMRERFEDGDMVLLCAHPARAHGFRRSHDFCLSPLGEITLDAGLPVIYAGVALVGCSVFEGTPDGAFPMLPLFETALEDGRLKGVLLDAPWFHVGDPDGLAEAEQALKGS